MKNNDKKVNYYALIELTKRSIKLFLKDRANVFFSLLSPLIVLVLYILFLGEMQVDSILSYIPEEFSVDSNAVKSYIDSWMIAGVLASACITVSLGANNVMVRDKEKGMVNDQLSSPIKKWVITLSYFLSNYIITVIIAIFAFIFCIIYLLIGGGIYLSFTDIIITIGLILLSSLSSTFITVFICSFFKTETTLGAFIGIMSAVLGFLIGAYMPMSVMPKAAVYVSALIPGSHSTGLFRTVLMRGSFEVLSEGLPIEIAEEISKSFSADINFFGNNVSQLMMILYLVASVVIFCGLNVLFAYKKKINYN